MEVGNPIGRTLRAGVSSAALDAAVHFFNGSPTDVMRELFQNARRAGASRIDVEIDDKNNTVSVTDDGSGIEDPAMLLTLGGSRWPQWVAHEHPAGMGSWATCPRAATPSSK